MIRRFPVCFVSCSSQSEDVTVVGWFERVLISLEFDPIKAMDIPQPRPPSEKISDMIRTADCFVAVVTRRAKVEGADSWLGPEWVQNEIGMAFQAEKPMAIFIEEGIDPGGLGPWATDYVTFARSDMGAGAPNVVRYLVNLRRAVVGSTEARTENIPAARALGNELTRFADLIGSVDKPTNLPWQMSYITATHTGRFYMLPEQVQDKVRAAYAAIEEFTELVRPPFRLGKKDKEEAFAPDRAEQVRSAKKRVLEAATKAILELMQLGYPEEWKEFVDRIKKGQSGPDSSE